MVSETNVNEIDTEVLESIPLSDAPELESAETPTKIDLKEGVETNVLEKGKRIVVTLLENVFEIKRVVEHQWKRCCGVGESERTRAYHVWPGNNVFFFRGRLICGPDPRGLLLTAVSISLSTWIFTIYVAHDFANHSGLIISFSLILTIIVLVNLMLVSMIDPGIIPRNDQSSHEFGSNGRTKKRNVTVNGVEVKLKYCRICNIYRPPRSCHCAVCDNCVEKFDHHCPWIGQCIGLRNYRFYLAFLVTTLVFFAYVFAFSCWRFHLITSRSGTTGLFAMLRNCPEAVALASFSLAAVGFVGGLACYHGHLIAINQTAYENFQQRYVGCRNPYDNGFISNVKEVLLVPMPPSRVDFRAEVTQNRLNSVIVV